MFTHNLRKAFTLIELMVVISIIGTLASMVLVSLENAKNKAEDSVRIQTIKSFEHALELYFLDYGEYPRIRHGVGRETTCGSQTENWGHCDRLKELTDALEGYINIEPESLSDVNNDGYYFNYASQDVDNWKSYGIMFYLKHGGSGDGGYYDNAYEAGFTPKYCKNKYTGTDADWLNKTGAWTQICRGGN